MDSKHYKAIDRYYTTAKYYIGINFGCEYTSVSLFPGKNGELISHMFRVPTVVYCNGDNYTLADSDFAIGEFQMLPYFKGLPSQLTHENKEALRIFFSLIVNKIFSQCTTLQFNHTTGKANFKICVTYPSCWERMISDLSNQYRQFLQETAGLLPFTCVSEASAINTSFIETTDILDSGDQPYLILDIKSSTVDFTLFQNTSIIHECSMGYNVAFDGIIDKIVQYGYTETDDSEENIANMSFVENQRAILHLGSSESKIYQVVSYELDRYLIRLGAGNSGPFIVDVRLHELIPNTESRTKVAFSIYMEYSDIIKIISEYLKELKEALMIGMRNLQSYDISPKRIFLAGDVIKYNIIFNMIKDLFPDHIVYRPDILEYVVSDGAALFLYSLDNKVNTQK